MNAFNSLFRIISYKSLSVSLYDALQLCCNDTVSYSLVNNLLIGVTHMFEDCEGSWKITSFFFHPHPSSGLCEQHGLVNIRGIQRKI